MATPRTCNTCGNWGHNERNCPFKRAEANRVGFRPDDRPRRRDRVDYIDQAAREGNPLRMGGSRH
jgi:hypothetical protein